MKKIVVMVGFLLLYFSNNGWCREVYTFCTSNTENTLKECKYKWCDAIAWGLILINCELMGACLTDKTSNTTTCNFP